MRRSVCDRDRSLSGAGRATVWVLAVALVGVAITGGGQAVTGETGPVFQVEDEGPTANVTVSPNPAHPGESVTFNATASVAGDNETIVECAFDTDGDGDFETRRDTCRVERSYDLVGTYNVSVRITTSADRTATDSTTLTITDNIAPRPAITVDPSAPIAGDTVTFSADASSDPDGEIIEYSWTVDGETYLGETVAVEFAEPGDYQAVLTVTDDAEVQNDTAVTVTVRENSPPTASLVVDPSEARIGDVVTLDASQSADPDGSIVEYRWDLDGDGTVETTTTVPARNVTVEVAGERSIGVVVVDDRGATATTTATLVVAQEPQTQTTTATQVNSTDEPSEGEPGDEPTEAGAGDGPTETVPRDEPTERAAGTGPTGGILSPGIVPVVPDWFGVLALVGIAALAVAHRRQSLSDRLREWRQSKSDAELRRDAAEKGTSFAIKTAFKRLFRLLADIVEGSGDVVGSLFEWVGRTIRRGSRWVATVLRKLGD